MDIRHSARSRAKSLLKTTKCLAFALPFLGTQTALAITPSWTGATDTVWSTGTNWTGGTAPTALTDTAIFSGLPATLQPTNSAAISLSGLNFNGATGTFTVTNGLTMTLAGLGIANSSGIQQNIINNAGATLDLQAGDVGPNVAITSAGTLNIMNTANATGAAILNDTTFSIANVFGTSATVGSLAGDGTVDLGQKILIVGGLNTDTTVAGVISGADGQLTKVGTGTLTLTGANTYTGATTISGGTLQIGQGSISGVLPGTGVINNGTLAFNRADSITFAGQITGSGSLEQRGIGTLTLTADNLYSGLTTITAGNLSIGGGGTTGSIMGDVVNNNSQGTLTFNRSNALTYSGIISGAGMVTKAGTNTVILLGNNTYTGLTTIAAGNLQLGNGGTVGSILSDITSTSGGLLAFNHSDDVTYAQSVRGNAGILNQGSGKLTLTGDFVSTGGLAVTGSGAVQLGNGGTTGRLMNNQTTVSVNSRFILNHSDDVTLGNSFTGTGQFVKEGTNALTIIGNHSYAGGMVVNGGRVTVGNGTPALGTLSAAPVVLNNSSILGFNRPDGMSISALISGTGSVEQNGTGQTYFTTDNTYTGTTTVNSGALNFGNVSNSGSVAGNVLVNANGTLIFNRQNTFTYSGVISGAGAVSKVSAGTAILTGNNTYTGPTTISAGNLILGNGGTTGSLSANTPISGVSGAGLIFNRQDDVIMTQTLKDIGLTNRGAGKLTITSDITPSAMTVESGAVIQLGNGGTSGRILNTFSIVDQGTFIIDHSDDMTFASVFTNVGKFVKAGTNNVTLIGNSTATGTTVIQGGTLTIGNGLSPGAGSLGIGLIVNNGTLALNRPDSFVVVSSITGPGSVVALGGATTLGQDNTYTGVTTVNSGATLTIGNGGAAGSVVGNIVNNGTLGFNRTGSQIYAGVISGSGTLIKNSANSLILTGNSTYTGLTTLNTGTLQLGNGGTSGMIDSDVLVPNFGNLVFNRADDVIFTHLIQGTSNAIQVGPGKLTLTNDDTLNSIQVNGGVLQVGDGATSGSLRGSISVSGLGTLIFDRSDSSLYTGVLSGVGTVIKHGAGDLILTADNPSYTGTLYLEQGVLRIGTGGASGSLANATLVNNGELIIDRTGSANLPATSGTGSVTTNRVALNVTNNNTYTGLTTINNGSLTLSGGGTIGDVVLSNANFVMNKLSTYAYNGVISGSGALMKPATGVVALNGVNTYTGDTNVNAGTLLIGDLAHSSASIAGNANVASGATLGGFGTIGGSVDNSGTVAPGASIGTLTIAGDYNQSAAGTLAIELNSAGQNDLLAVQGTANIAGTLTLVPQGFLPGHEYTFLTATNGINGSFSNVNGLGQFSQSFLIGQLNSDGNNMSVSATLNADAVAAAANTPNRRALVAYLLATNGGTAGMQALIAQATTNGELDAVLDEQNTASIYANQDLQLAQTGSWFERELAQRISINGSSQRHFWVTPYGSSASIDSDSNAAGLDTGLGGLAFGVDMPLANGVKVGAAAAATYFSSDSTNTIDATSSGTLFQVGVYSDYSVDNWTFGAGLDVGGTSDVDTTRNFADVGVNDIDGSNTSTLVSEQLRAAYDVALVNNGHLHPFVGLVNQNVHHDAFTETGDTQYALNVSSGNYNSTKSQVGTALVVPMGHDMDFVGSAAWQHEFSDVNGSISATMVDVTTDDNAYPISGAQIGRDSALVNAGIVLVKRDTMNVAAMYEGIFADGYSENGGKLQFNFIIG